VFFEEECHLLASKKNPYCPNLSRVGIPRI
jgi:hypothetical protein